MAFSIEALQSKSKLNNMKICKFAASLHPELAQQEDDALIVASQNIKKLLSALVAKIKDTMQSRNSLLYDEASVDVSGVVVSEQANSEGFMEVTLANGN